MKLERIPEYLTVTVVTLMGMGLAVYMGKHTGAGDLNSVFKVVAAILAILVILRMRTRIWVLIPIFWPLTGALEPVPGHLPPRDLVILLVFGAFLAFKALKMVKIKPTFGWVELVLLINILYIISVYIRNPVGTLSMGSAKVGGRPYVEIIFALLACWVLIRVRIQAALAMKLPFLMVVGNLLTGFLTIVAMKIPFFAPVIAKVFGIYGGTEDGAVDSTVIEGDPENARAGYLVAPSGSVFLLLCSRFVPATLLNPIFFSRFILTFLCVVGALLSGFRSLVIEMALIFVLALYFRKGISSLIICAVLAVPLIAVLIGLQGNVVSLPFAAQRALCFLPGKWDATVLEDARGSTEWRLEIWRSVLTEGNKYIADKVWGDGFGFTHRQLEEMAASRDAQENFRITGDYHSGPLSSIRFVGFVGLGFFYLLLFSLSFRGWRLIRAAKQTPFYTLSLLVCIPMILKPVLFTFVFGAYGQDVVTAIYQVGLLNMMSASLSDYRKSVPDEANLPSPPKPMARPELGMARR